MESQMKLTIATLSLLVLSAPAFAAPPATPPATSQGAENRSPVATATLNALAAGVNVGQTISDRNTNPDNTWRRGLYLGTPSKLNTTAWHKGPVSPQGETG
jgi:hypothetical protein